MEQKYSKNVQKHLVKCPHCNGDVLDHMTKCVHCGGELVPKGYSPILQESTKKSIKLVLWIVLSIIAIALLILKFRP